ncbi:hypothetical protein I7I51_02124 [Histoplasma capsulatum]|uniref:Uncharacterized protein n=1 Tax=Ajellomyces capsulatus TaxID=5037 RepID=A0A8A1ME15_AJECA|nr:hypothetical protein I7I51_02124 [Histoplasma capsulatum]
MNFEEEQAERNVASESLMVIPLSFWGLPIEDSPSPHQIWASDRCILLRPKLLVGIVRVEVRGPWCESLYMIQVDLKWEHSTPWAVIPEASAGLKFWSTSRSSSENKDFADGAGLVVNFRMSSGCPLCTSEDSVASILPPDPPFH